jgi:ribose transport system permease protein
MIPFAAILAIVGLGQMLVIQQAGIDLSVPGSVSLAAVIVSALPELGDSQLLPAVIISLLAAVAIGLFNGFLIGFLKLNPRADVGLMVGQGDDDFIPRPQGSPIGSAHVR